MAASTLLLLLALAPPACQGYCWQAGWNPVFTGPPIVEQLTLTSARVSWAGLLKYGECADNVLVKHYKGLDTSNYKISDPLPVTVTTYIVHDLSPNQEYTYQMIAREEKGLLGVDYNRGEKTVFATSLRNREAGLEVRPESPVPVPVKPAGGEEQATNQTDTPVYTDSQKQRPVVAGLQVELLMGIIVAALVICIVAVGLAYNCAKKKGPEKDLELNSSMYDGDGDDEEGDSDDEDEEEEDEVSEETKKYDMMAAQNKQMENPKLLMRPMSVA